MSNDENLVIIDSQHNHGHLLRIDLSWQYTAKELVESLVPIASIY
jgi:hypothetical protein